MPRGTSRYDEARLQGRNWEPFGVSNIALRSEEIGFDGVWLTPGNPWNVIAAQTPTTVSTTQQDPTSGFSATWISYNAGTGSIGTIRRQVIQALTTGATYSAAIWVKKAPTSSATSIRWTSNNTAAWNTGASTKVTLTDQWQRVTITWTQVTNTTAYIMIGNIDVAGNYDSTCNGGVLIWGASFSAGSFPQGYAKTVSSTYTGPRGPTIDQNKEAAYLYWKYGIPTDPLSNTNPYKFRPPLIGA